MNSKHICLLGFSKQTEKDIQQYLVEIAPQYSFLWVSANSEKLDGIVVNAVFLETPQIKKYLSKVTCPSVAAYSTSQGKEIANEQRIAAIDLQNPIVDRQKWLNALLSNAPSSLSYDENVNIPKINKGLFSDNVQELIHIIKERKPVYILAQREGKTTFLKPKEGHAYINFARDEVPGIELWQWQEAVEDAVQIDAMRRINIDQWLFETIWQSKAAVFEVNNKMLYKLIRWPQPFSQVKRTEALRLAAQIKFKPVTIADLVDKTNYSSQLVEQFLFATNQAGQVEAIQPEEGVNEQHKAKPVRREDPDREAKRGFIGRLRKRLGL